MAENIRKQAQDVQANSVINYLNMCKHSIRNAMNYQTIHESNFKKHPDYDDYKTFLQPRDYFEWWSSIPGQLKTHMSHYLPRCIENIKSQIKKRPDLYSIPENVETLFHKFLENSRSHGDNGFSGKLSNPAKIIIFNKIMDKLSNSNNETKFSLPNIPIKTIRKFKKNIRM